MLPQATLNNVTIQPPYEEQGLRFETTGYKVSIHLPELRSYVSLSPSWTVVVSLAMEHFLNNTQGQCGESCIMPQGWFRVFCNTILYLGLFAWLFLLHK